MFDFHWIDPAVQNFVGQHRLNDLEAVLARRDGELMQPVDRGRDTIRLRIETGSGGGNLYIQREQRPRWKDLLRQATAGDGFWTWARAEFEILQKLRAVGISCPRPLV